MNESILDAYDRECSACHEAHENESYYYDGTWYLNEEEYECQYI